MKKNSVLRKVLAVALSAITLLGTGFTTAGQFVGTVVKKTFTVQVNAKLTNTSTISATTVKKGSTVTVNGSAKGGAGDYTYAVMYKQKAQSKWTTKQDFSTNANVSVKPGQTTDYDICIKVKDKDGTIVKKYFAVTVTK